MNLTEWRKLKGVTLAQLGELVGRSHVSIMRLEKGEQWPGAGVIAAIIEATDGAVTADDLHAAYTAAKAVKGAAKQPQAAE